MRLRAPAVFLAAAVVASGLAAPAQAAGVWVGAAVAAYSLPAVAGAAVFARWMRGRSGALGSLRMIA